MDERILQIETAAMKAWPSHEARDLDGWQLRWHTVESRRVNSVWPNDWQGQIPLAIKLQEVEAYYSLKGQPARYQVCPAAQPAGLDAVLEARGYWIDAPTGVQVADAEAVYAAAASVTPRFEDVEIRLFQSLNRAWVAGYCFVQGAPETQIDFRMDALGRVEEPSVYVSVSTGGVTAAVGRGVFGEGWLGIFGMATHENYRRCGLASTIICHLSDRALALGTRRLYLQVMDVNEGALQLYGGLGFKTLYSYHYRTSQPGLFK